MGPKERGESNMGERQRIFQKDDEAGPRMTVVQQPRRATNPD